MLALLTPGLLNIFVQSLKGIVTKPLRSIEEIISSQLFWGESVSTLARRSAEEGFSSINLSPFAH